MKFNPVEIKDKDKWEEINQFLRALSPGIRIKVLIEILSEETRKNKLKQKFSDEK